MNAPLGPQDHERADNERDRYRHRLEQRGLDVLSEEKSEHGGRHEGDQDVRGEPLRCAVGEESAENLGELVPVLPNDGEHRAGLDHDLEDLPFVVVEAQQVTDKDEVTCGGDREKLGEALDDAHDDGLE